MRRTRSLVLAGTALLAVGLTGCASTADSDTQLSRTPAPASAEASGSSGTPSPVGSGSAADIAFAQLMIPHHEQAVEMADLALDPTYGASPQVQALAADIKDAQDPEIIQMQGWLTAWGAPSAMASASTDAMGDMPGMDMGGVSSAGMMTADQMAALAAARGTAFDQMWLAMMISHHEGAIAMAQEVAATSSNPEVQQLAASIISSQQAEITTMSALLTG